MNYIVFVWVLLDSLKNFNYFVNFAFVLNPVGLNDVILAMKIIFFQIFYCIFSNFGGDDFIFDAISSNV